MKDSIDYLRDVARVVPPWLVRPFGGPTAIFFHGIEDGALDTRVQINHHTLTDFRKIARVLKRDFDVLPYAAMDDVLKRPERHPRAVFLMSDDGYANLFTTGAAVLAEFGLPWTLFVSTHHIDSGEPNPIVLARLFFHFAPPGTYRIPHYPEPIVLGDGDRESQALHGVKRLRLSDAARAGEAVAAMAAALPDLAALLARLPSERFLTWQEIRTLSAEGVEIGAHAHQHWAMSASQGPAYLREQARISRARIAAELGRAPRAFAYPFGNHADVSADGCRAVREAGFTRAFTTLSGTLDASRNPYLMPRYGLGPRDTHLPALLPMLRIANRRLVHWQDGLANPNAASPDPARMARPVPVQAE